MSRNQETIELNFIEEEQKILSRLAEIDKLKKEIKAKEENIAKELDILDTEEENERNLELENQKKTQEPEKSVINEEKLKELEVVRKKNDVLAQEKIEETREELEDIYTNNEEVPKENKPEKKGMNRREALIKGLKWGAGIALLGVTGSTIDFAIKSNSHHPKKEVHLTPEEKKKQNKEAADKKEFGRLYEQMDLKFYRSLNNLNGKLIYLYHLTNEIEKKEHSGYWIMINKDKAKMYLLKDGKLQESHNILLGKTGDYYKKEPHDDDEKITPSVFSVLSNKNFDQNLLKEYGGTLWRIENPEKEGESILMNEPILQREIDSVNRDEFYDNPFYRRTPNGNIRNPKIREEMKHFISGKTRIVILPDDPCNFLNPETGKLEKGKLNPKVEKELIAEMRRKIKECIDKNR